MNLLLLAVAFRAWSGSALSTFLRIMAAIGTFSLEIQLVTWLHVGSVRSVRLVNLVAAAVGVSWHAYRRSRRRHAGHDGVEAAGRSVSVPPARDSPLPPMVAVATLVLVIAALASMRPVMGADPYHLHRVDQITESGTLAYDPAALDIKINALAGVYELLLADLRIAGMSTALVRLHGVFGFGFYLLAIAAVAPWAGIRRRWLLIALLVVPAVFHQLVLVKNDLFGAVPAFVALAWVVTRGRQMSRSECAAAAALAGFAVGIKIASAPIALVVGGFLVADHRDDWRRNAGRALSGSPGGDRVGPTGEGVAAAQARAASVFGTAVWMCAGVAGAIAGGLLFTLIENHLVYGAALRPYVLLGNRYEHVGEAAKGVGRLAISLVDLGTLTPRLWPGRGGWGSTLGLPLVWALVVLGLHWRDAQAKRALLAAGACLLVFGATYPDADIAHRMVIAPGLLLVVVALGCVEGGSRHAAALRTALIAVIGLSALQIGRSAWLYVGFVIGDS